MLCLWYSKGPTLLSSYLVVLLTTPYYTDVFENLTSDNLHSRLNSSACRMLLCVLCAVKAFLAQAKEEFNKKWDEAAQVPSCSRFTGFCFVNSVAFARNLNGVYSNLSLVLLRSVVYIVLNIESLTVLEETKSVRNKNSINAASAATSRCSYHNRYFALRHTLI